MGRSSLEGRNPRCSLPNIKKKKKGRKNGKKTKIFKTSPVCRHVIHHWRRGIRERSLPVKAAEEEETYTVRFEAYEGTCETESVSCTQRGKHHPAGCIFTKGITFMDGWILLKKMAGFTRTV